MDLGGEPQAKVVLVDDEAAAKSRSENAAKPLKHVKTQICVDFFFDFSRVEVESCCPLPHFC